MFREEGNMDWTSSRKSRTLDARWTSSSLTVLRKNLVMMLSCGRDGQIVSS